MGDAIKFFGATLLVFLGFFAGIVGLVHCIETQACEAYGRQTGREVVYNWGCYAADDDGRMVPAGQIDKRLTITTK